MERQATRRYAPTGVYRTPTGVQIKHFQDLHSIPQTGVVGPRTWNLMVSFMSGRALDKAKIAYHKYHPDTTRDKIVRAALDGYANRSHIRYVQTRPMVWHHTHPPTAEGLFAEDCSSFATWCYWVAGAPDPCGMGYNGYGNTDSMLSHGRRVSLPKLGDLSLYTDPGHVAVIVKLSPITVVSNGHYPMQLLPAQYGHPFVGYYTYIEDCQLKRIIAAILSLALVISAAFVGFSSLSAERSSGDEPRQHYLQHCWT